MSLTEAEIHECLALLRDLSDRPRINRARQFAGLICALLLGALLGALL